MLCFLKGLGIIVAFVVGAIIVFSGVAWGLNKLDDKEWWQSTLNVLGIAFGCFLRALVLFGIIVLSLKIGGCPPEWIK